ncbi:MAG: ABC transporter substrate-binding protein [Acutalibacteraceae bacterium]
MKKLLVFISAFFMLCFQGCKLNTFESKVKKVKLNEVTRSIFYAPQYVAMELGYFKEENIDIELVTGEGSDKTMTSILSSQADIGLLGSSSVISVCEHGKEHCPMIFAQLTKKDGSFLVGRENNFDWNDLRGKRIIAGRKGGVPEMVFEYILKSKGFDINKDLVLLNNIQFNLMGMAFSRGVGDYVLLFEPTSSTLIKEKGFYKLKSLGKECQNMVYTCYCASEEYINNNPQTIFKFTRAIYRAQLWVASHSADEIANLILPYFIDLDYNLAKECVKNYLESEVWSSTPVINPEEFDLIQDVMIQAGELGAKIDMKKLVNNNYSMEVVN